MKKNEEEKLYFDVLNTFAFDYANKLCEIELYFQYIVFKNDSYNLDAFKKTLLETFVYDEKKTKKIFDKNMKKIKNLKKL